MSVSFISPNRTVLMIGDDALYIYKVTARAVTFVDDIPWVTEGFEGVVSDLLKKDCGGKPVLVLNDMTDQHFKGGQRMPKVSAMDKKNVLRRKIQVAFPNYPIRGALPIKPKKGEKTGEMYLFAAVPMSDQIAKTMEAVKISLLPIAGFVLLPVEAADMVAALSKKFTEKGGQSAKWTIFMGQHKSGALRQVITRDGQLAMTRMTPVSDINADPQGWAADVVQEFKATISYLSRFGFSSEDGTDVILIGNPQLAEAVESKIEIECDFRALTPSEAANALGSKIGLQQDANYADALHAAWAGRKNSFALPMHASDLDKIHKPRQAAAAIIFLLLAGGAYLAWDTGNKFQSMMAAKDDLKIQQGLLVQAEAEYREEVARMEALGYNIELMQDTIDVFMSFEDESIETLAFIKKVGIALGDGLRLDKLSYQRVVEETNAATFVDPNAPVETAPLVMSTLSMSFPPTMELENGIREVQGLQSRLREQFPGYDVEIVRQVARPEYTRDFQGVAGQTDQELAAKEDYVAELVIRGRVK